MDNTSVACIALNNGKVLIAHRNPVGDMGGRWEFPGGKVEKDESDEHAVVREFGEEFGISVTVGEYITDTEFIHAGKTCRLHAYRIYVSENGIDVPYTLSEHSGYEWVDPEEIKDRNFVDSDMKIYPSVLEYIKKTCK